MNKIKINQQEFNAVNVFYDSSNVDTRKLQCHLSVGNETLQQVKTAFESANTFDYGYYSNNEWKSVELYSGYSQIDEIKFKYGDIVDGQNVTMCIVVLDKPNLRTRFDNYVAENDAAICELYEMFLGGE